MGLSLFAPTIASIPGLQAALDAKAPLASPTFTGTISGGNFSGNLSQTIAALTGSNPDGVLLTQTWNDGSNVLSGLTLAVTDTASSLSSYLILGAVGGTPRFSVFKQGCINVIGATITADRPTANLSQTWNNSGVTFQGISLDVTDTASAALSRLLNLKVGGNSKFVVGKDGKTWLGTTTPSSSNYTINNDGTITWVNAPTGGMVHLGINDGWGIGIYSTTIRTQASIVLGWTSANPQNSLDCGLARNAIGVIEFNNGTKGTLGDFVARNGGWTGYLDIAEMSAPAAPSANTARFYCDDSGGKSRLVVRFPSGAVQQIAIEP